MNKNRSDVALFVLGALKSEGIKHIFLVPGYVIDPFLPNFSKAGINAIVAAHEGGAAYMADGYGRASENFGVCMGVGGPGVTNMVTALSSAYGDRTSVLVVAGKIPASWEGLGTFQDSSGSSGIDDIAIMRPITGFAATLPDVQLLASFLRKAIRSMRGMERLPAFLSIPEDMHRKRYSGSYSAQRRGVMRMVDVDALPQAEKLLTSTRIAILAGNGCIQSGASKELRDFANKYGVPVVTTMRAKGALSESDPMSFGVFGVGGTLQADKLLLGSKSPRIRDAEVLLVVGASLNENNTHFRDKRFPPGETLLRIDTNPNNAKRVAEYQEQFIMADAKTFLESIMNNKEIDKKLSSTRKARQKWLDTVRKTPYHEEEPSSLERNLPIHPALAIAKLRDAAPRNTLLVVDSGAHTFFAGHYWKSYGPNEFLFSSTMGPMGYGIAMAIGAKLSRPEKPCICVVGDGSVLMHGMELHTAVRYKVPIIVLVINNSALGNVYLRARENGKDAAELAKIPTHDWAQFAQSLGAEGERVDKPNALLPAYKRAIEHTSKANNTPFLIDVVCDREPGTPNQFARS